LTADRRLAGWSARDLATHLDQLATAAAAWRDGKGERPIVTLHLASGQRHTGQVLELARATLALQSLPQRGTVDVDVTVIPVARIEALTFHAAQSLVATAPSSDAATSMLDLRRRVKALADLIATRIGRTITIELGAGELAQLAPLFETLRIALEHVCADELGRASLAERVQRIELRAGPPGLALANGQLVASGSLSAERISSELDAVL
jgi:hypothetical protein